MGLDSLSSLFSIQMLNILLLLVLTLVIFKIRMMSRFQPSTSAAQTYARYLYIPLGVLFVLLRILVLTLLGLVLFIVTAFLPYPRVKAFILSLFLPFLGIVTVFNSHRDVDLNTARLFACNSISTLDAICWSIVYPSSVFLEATRPDTVATLRNGLKYGPKDRAFMVLAEIQHSASDQRIGHFSGVAFGHDIPTYPVAVSVQSPAWLGMNVHVPSASKVVNRLWVLYSPCTMVTFSALPAVSHGAPASSDTDSHMVQAHADDCQYRIAHALGVGVHARRPIHERSERVTGTATHTRVSPGVHTVSPEVRVGMSVPDNVPAPVQPGVSGASVPVATIQAGTNRSHRISQEVKGSDDMKGPLQNTHQDALVDMLARVQEVFPSHDREVIRGDLRETMNVDATIENVITGALQFPPNAPTGTEPAGKHEMSYDRHTGSQLDTSSAATAAVDDRREGHNGSESPTSVHAQNTATQPHTQDVGAHTAQRTTVQPGACAAHLLASHTDRQFSDKMLAAYIDCGSDIPTAWSYDDSLSKKKLALIAGARKYVSFGLLFVDWSMDTLSLTFVL